MMPYPRPPRLLTSATTTAIATAAAFAAVLALASPVAAQPKPETERAWQDYVRGVEARRARELATPASASASSSAASRVAVAPMGDNGTDGSIPVAGGGLIHHWRGRVLVPDATLDDVLRHVRKAPRQSDVLASKILEDRGDTLRVYLKLTRSELITVTYNTEHLVEIARHGPGRASSRSVATKIAELADAGTPREREKPQGDDLGLLWKLHAYWRYEEVPGGVLVECESLSLSRGIPTLLKPFASGTVDRIARESMTRTLETFREQAAVHPTQTAHAARR